MAVSECRVTLSSLNAPPRAGDAGPNCLVYSACRVDVSREVGVADLPTGTVTFLFSDIEGSTRLWEEHPDGMRVSLAQHDEVVRDAIESHGGSVVKQRGDGFHAAFGTAGEGIGAAIAAQRALGAEAWGVIGPLRVRIGLHTGAASLRDGDYFGSAVNRAARLMDVAHGGQIVCSRQRRISAGKAWTRA